MERNQQLRRQLASMRQSLFDQGHLDEQFILLEELQDDANPNFVEEVVTLHYRDSARLITTIERALEKSPLDFNKLDGYMHQFKGSSTSIGAQKVKAESTQLENIARQEMEKAQLHLLELMHSFQVKTLSKNNNNLICMNPSRCMKTFQLLKRDYATLRRKLEAYFQLARQAGPNEIACRPK
ncbi:hypothetical protein CICLE_v10027101mg [Citrus x clementina]|uniref:Histidine-containing phosphotransfer protein n=1 Tax=Citrus clementina TaxID=85681 RepID=V4UL69_CITCL|nr:hypothetical protein CICLE_v10027101mg [Citrus x clementina]